MLSHLQRMGSLSSTYCRPSRQSSSAVSVLGRAEGDRCRQDLPRAGRRQVLRGSNGGSRSSSSWGRIRRSERKRRLRRATGAELGFHQARTSRLRHHDAETDESRVQSVNNPRALPFITALANTHVVLAQDRRNPDAPISSIPLPPLTHLWYSRHRSATAKASLRHQAWLIDPEGFSPSLFASVNALDSPEVQQRMEPFGDTFEVLIMDGFGRTGEGSGFTPGDYVGRSWEQFEAVVADTLLRVSGLANVGAAIQFGERESYRLGDLLFDFKGIGEEFSQLGEGKLGNGGGGKKKSKESDSLRDDDLAFKLSRSLFGR